MRKFCVLTTVLVLCQLAIATPDISYSSDPGGHWSYSASATQGEGVFSFIQPIGVDDVQGFTTDALVNGFLYIPNLAVSNLVPLGSGIYIGNVSPVSTTIVIKDGAMADVLVGTLATGGIVTVGTTASLYPVLSIDITITGLPNAIGSDFINTLNVGDVFDFDLTLNGASMASMILNNQNNLTGSTLSGSMTSLIPEPATMTLLGLGIVALRIRRK